ncbi:TetR/AcrR family transcriptional regulator [Denitrobaculum tricleocarpae]|uniref:TetR/AcrR family transcriptional regulator n=1 Tax=Denitrobaculum tricleocarpae TaxID=2591009 RepID=A0A545TKK0_9PROT|nr:TetR/AcrR family transcriptional regulator [Denitrobaculum tricleocarpae]TQV77691.1 TetR/AcrR family transcriptional regulator [Denitrobaculum tricleocarpae]
MRSSARVQRQEKIEKAAYELLEAKGYAGTSMLSIATRAKASNETLYRWYGDKQGLFKAMVVRNARDVKELLENELQAEHPPLKTLRRLGPQLLGLVLGQRAVALNRAAAADASGELGAALTEGGRDSVVPLIAQVFQQARKAGVIQGLSTKDAVELYLNLLIGDLQIRRVIGALPEPTTPEIKRRADRALKTFQKIAS